MKKGKFIIPILIGAVGLYFIFRKKKPDTVLTTENKEPPNKAPNKVVKQQVVVPDFPLKYGSRGNLVKQLQTALMKFNTNIASNFATGIFGTNTENELFKLKNKKTVDSQKELNLIIINTEISYTPTNPNS